MSFQVRRALISVYDKTGVVDVARGLRDHGVEIISTGSTAATLQANGITVQEVANVTGFPEILDGRVKTLHPHIHGAILADRNKAAHTATLTDLGITPIDVVIGNLYPFADTVSAGGSHEEIIEKIDIGGPTLIRAAAKNYASVAVVVDPKDYAHLVENIANLSIEYRHQLAAKAFEHILSYDSHIAAWFASETNPATEFPEHTTLTGKKLTDLRYGENPHQRAALYYSTPGGLATASVLQGKAMSFNNYVDADAAIRAVHDFTEPAVAIIKHANPCGIAVAQDIQTAHTQAHACDSLSAFGGVIALNRPATPEFATQVKDIFTEVIIAPEFPPETLEILADKKNLRLVHVPNYVADSPEFKQINGGFLVQDKDKNDASGDDPDTWKLASGPEVSRSAMADLIFAWKAIRAVKSNAIVLAHNRATVGIGMGQVNRVDAARLAVTRSQQRSFGAVAASDAFFPFADGLEILINAGITAVVQPGGSVRDQEVIDAAQSAGVSMYFTNTRHFAH